MTHSNSTLSSIDNSFIDHHEELHSQGWSILPPEKIKSDIRSTLENFGRIIPQFGGLETFEVTFTPGFDDLPYSQSMNGIGPHTEAPVYDPPPRYLALHCHRQATCGGGYTSLADGYEFLEFLPPEAREWIDKNQVEFGATTKPGEPAKQVFRTPLLETTKDGQDIFRFSFNQFHYGDVNPSSEQLKTTYTPDVRSPLVSLAAEGEKFFLEKATPILIPNGCILIWDNWRLMHARSEFKDRDRHLTRYWLS